jgi:glycosyltransferase involved in cell wall biosynthesis
MAHRLHLVSLPHTQTRREWSYCAYTEKVRKAATMMHKRGHEVYLYAPGATDAECTEFISTGPGPATPDVVEPEWTLGYFKPMNDRVVSELAGRLEPHDFICVIAGTCQQPIAEVFPAHMTVEFGIGYEGTFSPYRVFESYAWMHSVYGAQQGAMGADGRFYDCVIPNYFEVNQFPPGQGAGGYLLYVGRLIDRKGVQVAVDVSKRTGVPLVLAGQGTPPDHGLHVGVVGPEDRARLMGAARALICPTLYVEPFGGVAVEAQLTGTPVLTTDWGAFTETVEDRRTGYRCRTLAEFCQGLERAPTLDRGYIRERAISLYSTEVVSGMYEEYFDRLAQLWDDGFYAAALPGKQLDAHII